MPRTGGGASKNLAGRRDVEFVFVVDPVTVTVTIAVTVSVLLKQLLSGILPSPRLTVRHTRLPTIPHGFVVVARELRFAGSSLPAGGYIEAEDLIPARRDVLAQAGLL
jgi:hypothetical protein